MLTGREKPPFSPEMTLCLYYFSHFSKNLLAPVDTVCFLEPRESPVTSDTVRLSMGTLLHPLTTSRQLLPQTSLAVDPCLRIPLLPSLPEGSHPTLPSERRPLLLQPPASLRSGRVLPQDCGIYQCWTTRTAGSQRYPTSAQHSPALPWPRPPRPSAFHRSLPACRWSPRALVITGTVLLEPRLSLQGPTGVGLSLPHLYWCSSELPEYTLRTAAYSEFILSLRPDGRPLRMGPKCRIPTPFSFQGHHSFRSRLSPYQLLIFFLMAPVCIRMQQYFSLKNRT